MKEMAGMLNFSKPAKNLLGRDLGDGWTVVDVVVRPDNATGGTFATPYIAEKNGKKAFVKAMDLSRALLRPDLLEGLQHFGESIQFEGSLLEICASKGMSRVVQLLHHGQLELDPKNPDPVARRASTVFYFVFELARSDLRQGIEPKILAAKKVRVLFNVALGIHQLHSQEIAHQDIKPSNVVLFESDQKLADLGRASKRGTVSPNDQWKFPGDQTYMPPEYLYGYVPSEYTDRRLGTDAYGLGSLLAFLFSLESATPLLLSSLANHARPDTWKGGSFSEVLPFLVDAHARVCDYLSGLLPGSVGDELLTAYRELTHPDPRVRGHPRARLRVGRPLGIERYVSLFDLLGKKLAVSREA